MVCLDTSSVISILDGETLARETVEKYLNEGDLSITSITEYELLKHPSKLKREIATEFINRVKVYDFDRKAAAKASEIYIELRNSGTLINENDILIAGIALSNDETLVTEDEKFKRLGSSKIVVIGKKG